jgi:hypothetical protein
VVIIGKEFKKKLFNRGLLGKSDDMEVKFKGK